MIDNLSLAISHGLMLLAAWRLLRCPDLDDDAGRPPAPLIRRRAAVQAEPPGDA